MTDRVFQDERSFEVSDGGHWVEVYIYGDITITIYKYHGWDSQRASFTITAQEATMLKEFLISKGY
jgi:hypothetical protein